MQDSNVGLMELNEVLLKRRSIRKYEDKPVDKSLVEEIIEIARFAPSWKNSQSVRYIAIYDNDIKNKINNKYQIFDKDNLSSLQMDFIYFLVKNW